MEIVFIKCNILTVENCTADFYVDMEENGTGIFFLNLSFFYLHFPQALKILYSPSALSWWIGIGYNENEIKPQVQRFSTHDCLVGQY